MGTQQSTTAETGQKEQTAKAAVEDQSIDQSSRLITGVDIEETPEAIKVSIKTNHVPDYTIAEPPLEQSTVLYFPEAGLGMAKTEFSVDNELIGTVSAVELIKGGPSKVVIPIKSADVSYEAERADDQNVLTIAFKKPAGYAEAEAETEKQAKDVGEAEILEGIEVTTTADDRVAINVRADGTIEKHKSFILPEPPRIVFDLPGISSSYDKEQRVNVNSDIVKGVRHFSHPGYLRVVLDVDKQYLSDFQAASRRDGLLIQVGEPAALAVTPPEETETVAVAQQSETKTEDVSPGTEAEAATTEDAVAAQMAIAEASQAGPQAQEKKEESPASEPSAAASEEPARAVEAEATGTTGTPEETEPEAGSATTAESEITAEPAAAVAAPTDKESVQKGTQQAAVESEIASAPAEVKEPAAITKKYDRPALVNKINFIEKQEGRSTLEIGTTHPVNFEIEKRADKKLRMTLENTNILSFRQRPLITTRFDSAVDLINPLQTHNMKQKGISCIDIQLREDVGFEATREGKTIHLDFAASSVPPDPARNVTIPVAHEIEIEEAPAEKEAPITTEAEKKPAKPEETAAEKAPATAEEEVTVAEKPEDTKAGAAVAGEMKAPAPEEAEAPLVSKAMEEAEQAPVTVFPGKKEQYTGEPIALDFYKTNIRNVIRILNDVSGKNFAIDKDVEGSVTLSFVNPVPWDQVLDLILEMNDLGMVEGDGIIRIATQETLRRQKEAAQAALVAEQELKRKEEELAPLHTEYFSISYSDAGSDILPHLESLLTSRGNVKVDARTNQVIMTDVAEKIDKAHEIIEKIDRVTPQVMIKGRIVETSSSFSREFGTEWGINNTYNSPGINIGTDGTYRDAIGGTYTYDVAMNSLNSPAQNMIGINFARIVGTPFSLDARLSLMESTGEVNIVSTPKVVTLDNKTAVISQGVEYPYTTVDDGEADTEFKSIELKLEVIPHVTPDNRISMKIALEKNDLGEIINGEQSFNTKKANTELLVNDGDTVVIGGIIKQRNSSGQRGVPWLSKIPLLGNLFKYKSKSNDKNELLIFITPNVLRLD
ncbi:MAG: type IV pilus secretin PilQ [Thermodesulfobacteriota bacterium]|nr:type IV pilus secretin PilQ [Thermodesulfobacteriota bacterium]